MKQILILLILANLTLAFLSSCNKQKIYENNENSLPAEKIEYVKSWYDNLVEKEVETSKKTNLFLYLDKPIWNKTNYDKEKTSL